MLTTSGILGGILIGIIGGGFTGLFAANNCEKKISKIVAVILCVALFFAIGAFGFSGEEIRFNNGDCFNCGTHYEAVTHRNGRTYYECPNCYTGTWK